jgi:hypothetical protein
MAKESFRKELLSLINKHSLENGSNTPDFMLADYLMACLNVYEETVKTRDLWYGHPTVLGTEIIEVI